MTDDAATQLVLVPFGALHDTVAHQALQERYPQVEFLTMTYEVPHELTTARASRPDDPATLAAEPVLTDEQREAFARAEVMVALDAPRHLPDVAPNLRWLQAIGSGIGQLRVCGLEGSSIVVTNAAGVASPTIAEWVLAQILSIYKRLDQHAAQQRAHVWEQRFGEPVQGKRVLVVGLGAIGEAVATRCAALGMRVVGVRRTPAAPGDLPPGVAELRHPDELLALAGETDVVVACVPGTAATDSLFGEAFFAALTPRAVFLNVGRGLSVDEDALVAALESGHLRAAALDVTREEPLPPDSPLWDVPNLHLSPHSSASLVGYMDRVWDLFLANLDAYLAGRPLRNVVDVARVYGSTA